MKNKSKLCRCCKVMILILMSIMITFT